MTSIFKSSLTSASLNQRSQIALLVLVLCSLLSCKNDPLQRLYGTWEGKTRIDQNISMTFRPDSTIEIETDTDYGKEIRKGTFQIIDRRIRIALTSLETYMGDTVKRQHKLDHDEALFTFTGKNEMVLRKGTMAIILHKKESP